MQNILTISRDDLLNYFVPQEHYTLVHYDGTEVIYTNEYEPVTFEFEGE